MKKAFIIMFSLYCMSVFATQQFHVHDGGKVTANIYADGLSRISLKDDRIKVIKGISGDYQIDKDDDLGDIYIKPNKGIENKPISLFITSERGNTYQLDLRLSASSSENIEIININTAALPEKHPKKLIKTYSEADVISLIKAGYNKGRHKGYAYREISKPEKTKLDKHFVMYRMAEYSGAKYTMDVLRVENKSKWNKTISEKNFMVNDNVISVAADSLSIPPKSYTNVYVVYKR